MKSYLTVLFIPGHVIVRFGTFVLGISLGLGADVLGGLVYT
jgi:hypothetical protein